MGEQRPSLGDTASETERSAEGEDYWSSELALSSFPLFLGVSERERESEKACQFT